MDHDIDKQEMKDYLLGTLDTERRTALEEEILCDPAVYEELLAVEEELIDEYVGGGLSKAEERQFETHFLITAERQKNLRFGRLLKRYMSSHPVLVPDPAMPVAVRQVEKTAPAKKFFPFTLASFGSGPAIAVSATIVACLGIASLGWLVARKSTESTAQHSASRLMVVTLVPGSMKSAGATQRVTVPPRGVDLKLELELTNTSFHNYKSQLFRESEPLQTNELKMEAKGDHNVVPLTITGEKLSPGEYQVKLCGVLDSGQKEFIDSYSFRVTTE